MPYEKLCEKESTHGNALQRDSHGNTEITLFVKPFIIRKVLSNAFLAGNFVVMFSGLRGNVQEHMEDGFGEALLNI